MIIISITLNTVRAKVAAIMVVLVLFIGIFGSYQRAHAFGPLILAAPAAAEATYVGAMIAITAGAGVATAGIEYVNDNIDEIKATARETWGLMSADMKDNFLQSMSQVGDGISVAGNFITNFLDSLKANETLNPPVQADYSAFNEYGRIDGANLYLSDGVFLSGTTSNGLSVGSASYKNNPYRTNVITEVKGSSGKYWVRGVTFLGGYSFETLNVGNTTYPTRDAAQAVADKLEDAFMKAYTLGSVLSSMSAINGATYNLTSMTGTLAPDLPTGQLDNIGNYLRDRIGTNGRLGVNLPADAAYTPKGQSLTYNPTAGWTTGAGVPYTGPIEWRPGMLGDITMGLPTVMPRPTVDGTPAYTDGTNVYRPDGSVVTDSNAISWDIPITWVDGKPYVVTPTGTMIDITTGEIVGETDIPVEGDTPATGELGGFFSKLWDWLKKILDAILAIPKAIIDALKALLLLLFVPTDGFWTDNFNNIRLALTDKLGADELLEEMDGLSGTSGGQFRDVVVTLMGVSGLEVIDADSVNRVLGFIHKFVRGVVFPFLIFYNINQLYKLIRGTSLVEATRNLNRMKGE